MRLVVILITLSAMLSLAANAHAGPLDYLQGRWAGWGKLYTSNGVFQRLKCITTYKISNGGTKAVQNFRCTSAGYRFSTVVNYDVNRNVLSGSWREQIYSAGGKLQGRHRPGQIEMTLRAETFKAGVSIQSAKCTQTINVRLTGAVDIERFDIQLKRC